MIYVCPNCGQSLSHPLVDGICICTSCSNLFDSSNQSRLLSAAWIARKKNYTVEQLKRKLSLSESEADLISDKVIIESYSHEEFLKHLQKIKISNRCYL